MGQAWRRALTVGGIVLLVVVLGSVLTLRYVAAAERTNARLAIDERIVDFRRAVASGDVGAVSSDPFAQVVVGAGERAASPAASGVTVDRSWVDDGELHELAVGDDTFLVVARSATVDGLKATVTVGRNQSDGNRSAAALRRALVVLSLFAAGGAALATRVVAVDGNRRGRGLRASSPGQRRTRSGPPSGRGNDPDEWSDGWSDDPFPSPRASDMPSRPAGSSDRGPLIRPGPTPMPPPPPATGRSGHPDPPRR